MSAPITSSALESVPVTALRDASHSTHSRREALVGGLALLPEGLVHATAAVADCTEEGEREEETSAVAAEVTGKVFIYLKVFGCSRFHRGKEYVQW